MKKTVLILLLIITTISMACKRNPASGNGEFITEKEALDAIAAFDQGWEGKNAAKVDSVLAPQYIYFTRSGGEFSRDSLVQTAGASYYSLDSVSRRQVAVYINGSTAIVSTRWRGVGQYRGKAFNDEQCCSVTLIKRNKKVQILSEHCTPVASFFLFK